MLKSYTLADNPNNPLNLFGCFPFAGMEEELFASDEEEARLRPVWLPIVPTLVLPITPKDEGTGPQGEGWRVELEVGIPAESEGEGWLRYEEDDSRFVWLFGATRLSSPDPWFEEDANNRDLLL